MAKAKWAKEQDYDSESEADDKKENEVPTPLPEQVILHCIKRIEACFSNKHSIRQLYSHPASVFQLIIWKNASRSWQKMSRKMMHAKQAWKELSMLDQKAIKGNK